MLDHELQLRVGSVATDFFLNLIAVASLVALPVMIPFTTSPALPFATVLSRPLTEVHAEREEAERTLAKIESASAAASELLRKNRSCPRRGSDRASGRSGTAYGRKRRLGEARRSDPYRAARLLAWRADQPQYRQESRLLHFGQWSACTDQQRCWPFHRYEC